MNSRGKLSNLPPRWSRRTKTAAELNDDQCDACGMHLDSGAALNSDRMIFYETKDHSERVCSVRCAIRLDKLKEA